jgi:hypothetical protein
MSMSNHPNGHDGAPGGAQSPIEARRDGGATPSEGQRPPDPRPRGGAPSRRVSAALAATMLAVGVGVGAAIGPAPEASFAGPSSLASGLPALIAALGAQSRSATPPASAEAEGASEEAPVRHRRRRRRHRARTGASAAAQTPTAGEEAPRSAGAPAARSPSAAAGSKLPPVTNVWLIELAGGTFAQAQAQPSATPYMHAAVLPSAALLTGWSAVDAQALAADAAAAAKTPLGGTPPLMHTIVQPPCPEGLAGATCAPETPGQLTAADQFLQTALSQVTGTAGYREHGIVVITFASIGIAAQSGLPGGASTATLTTQPAAGVALLSPFARAGTHTNVSFDPASPVHSLETLLHR